jgi:hypothetical protein
VTVPIFNPLDAYNHGLQGVRVDPRADEMLVDLVMRTGGDADGGRVAYQWGFVGAAKDKLSLLYPYVEQCYPGAFPGPSQLTGDCVAACAARVLLASMCCEAVLGKPDEETGLIEEAPEVSEVARKNVPIASESLWMWRGYDSDGWVCSEAARVAMEKGFLIRQNYPSLGFDFTKYTQQSIRVGGSKTPGAAVLAECRKHRARTVTVIDDYMAVGDFIASGFAVATCSSLGFANVRNEDGVSDQRGTWAHSQGLYGWDDRPVIIKKYGEPLVLWMNQWAAWNTGPRRILGTDLDIPEGAYWTKASILRRCKLIAYSSILGWPRKKLPDYGYSGHI